MKFTLNEELKVKVYFVEKDDELKMLDDNVRDYAKNVHKFNGENRTTFADIGPTSSNIVLIGIGENPNSNAIRQGGYNAGKVLNDNKVEEAEVFIKEREGIAENTVLMCTTEGFEQQDYVFDQYKTKKNENTLKKISYNTSFDDEEGQGYLDYAAHILGGVNLTRELVNTPSIDMYPEVLAQRAKEALEPYGIEVEIFDRAQIEAMGMEAFLAVAEGSDKEPRFIVMKYLPEGEDKSAIGLVGKGITYDSGGYALKPARSMSTMKIDMSGVATIVGVLQALAKNKVNRNVIGVGALCENMISGKSYKNGDIIGSMKGTTIEVNNTDAEGRVILADALYYTATEQNVDSIIDIATLTGACTVALGDYTTGALSNNPELMAKVSQGAGYSGEFIHEFQANDFLREQVKGKFGDLVNSTFKPGGAITAGIFLEHFVEGKPWVHLDIAPTAWADSQWGYLPVGATGIPVKSLHNFIKAEER